MRSYVLCLQLQLYRGGLVLPIGAFFVFVFCSVAHGKGVLVLQCIVFYLFGGVAQNNSKKLRVVSIAPGETVCCVVLRTWYCIMIAYFGNRKEL